MFFPLLHTKTLLFDHRLSSVSTVILTHLSTDLFIESSCFVDCSLYVVVLATIQNIVAKC